MRLQSKPNTGKHGISAANAYRANVKSAATDLEALIDAYGVGTLIQAAIKIEQEIAREGDCWLNRDINLWLNDQPLPLIRKQHKPKPKRRAA